MSEKVLCTQCKVSILKITAERTNDLCMPCAQKKCREEEQKYIEANRKEIDLYKDIDDLVEIIKIYHTKQKYDPLINYIPFKGNIEEVYKKLTEEDENRLTDLIIQEADRGNIDYLETIGLELMAYRSCDLFKVHQFMVDNNIYDPPVLFRNTHETIVDTLLQQVDEDVKNRDGILLALAWTGGQKVVSKFYAWRQKAPEWKDKLYIPPYEYPRYAGWEVESPSEVKKLYFEQCYPLLSSRDTMAVGSLQSCTQSNTRCQWCGKNLTNLLEIDLSESTFDFLTIEGKCLALATCETCIYATDILYMDFDANGNAKWSKHNIQKYPIDHDDYEKFPSNTLYMSKNAQPAFYSAEGGALLKSFSQIGGMPTWEQDAAYPVCPSCQKTMTFIAQLSGEEVVSSGYGTYYIYICNECKISATNYQQT
jgi:hypothetical protein